MGVIIYGTSHCPWCKKTREWMKENKVEFKDINVEDDEKFAKEAIKKSGQQGVPVIDIDGKIIVGFDEDAFKKTLKIK